MRFSVIHKVGVVSHRPRQHGSPVDEAPCWPRTHSKFFKGVLALTSRSTSSRSAVACKLVAFLSDPPGVGSAPSFVLLARDKPGFGARPVH